MENKKIKYKGIEFEIRELQIREYEYGVYVGENLISEIRSISGIRDLFNSLDAHIDYYVLK